jgi:hypothetical protein
MSVAYAEDAMTRCVTMVLAAAVCAVSCSPGGTPETGAPAGGAAAASTAAKPAADAKPQFRAVTIPAGTALHVKLTSDAASDTSKVEDAVRGELTQPITVDDTTVVPAGTSIRGTVLEAVRSGRVEGRARLAIGFDRLVVGDETLNIRTSRINEEAEPTKREDAKKVGIGAAAGAVVGAIAGGKKGAAVGTAVGAGAGGGVVAATRGDEVHLAAGTTVTTKLQDALTINVAVK